MFFAPLRVTSRIKKVFFAVLRGPSWKKGVLRAPSRHFADRCVLPVTTLARLRLPQARQAQQTVELRLKSLNDGVRIRRQSPVGDEADIHLPRVAENTDSHADRAGLRHPEDDGVEKLPRKVEVFCGGPGTFVSTALTLSA